MGTGDFGDHSGPGGALYNDDYVASLVGTPEEPDLVMHVGDVAYDRGNETVWDVFFRNIEPYARHIPYLTCVGNEDHWYNFAGYAHRFFLPSQALKSQEAPHYYSIDFSYMHLVSISTEAGLEPYAPGSTQYAWLEDDLKRASANRERVPWIVVLGHRPMYCSSNDYYDCSMWGPKARNVFEPLFQRYGVDLYLAGHVHSYERTFPVVNGTKLASDYDSPGATTHLMVGMGGAGLTGRWAAQPSWSATRIAHYGVGEIEMSRHNLTFTLVETQGKIQSADRIVITRPGAAAEAAEFV
jgi:3',5'-cyclic AMP phosphodiesterase CpdA